MGELVSKTTNAGSQASTQGESDFISSRNSDPILFRQQLDNNTSKSFKRQKKGSKNERSDFQLHRAASAGNFEVINHLIKKGYNFHRFTFNFPKYP